MREIGTSTKHDYTNAQMVTKASKNIIDDFDEVFTLKLTNYLLEQHSRYLILLVLVKILMQQTMTYI